MSTVNCQLSTKFRTFVADSSKQKNMATQNLGADKDRPFVIGVDLGGTNTVFGIVDGQGNIVAQDSIKTQAYGTAEEFVRAGVACLEPLMAQVGGIERVAGMGIGAPNANCYTGAIETAPNIAWAHDTVVPLAQMFSDQLAKATGRQAKLGNTLNSQLSTVNYQLSK